MRKIILSFSLFILIVNIVIFGKYLYQYYNCKDTNHLDNEIIILNNDIDRIKTDIENKQKEIEEIKNNNSEKTEVLEVWEKELEKVK